MAVGDEHLTIHIEDAGDGWFVARIAEEPAAISQGRTPLEARANVIAALHDLSNPDARPTEPSSGCGSASAASVDASGH